MPLKKYLNRFTCGILLMFLLTSCQLFQKKGGSVERLLVMYTIISENLSNNIAEDIKEVKRSVYLPEYFDEGGEGNVIVLLEYNVGKTPVLKRLFRDEFGVATEEILMEYEGRSAIEPELLEEVMTHVDNIFKPQETGLIFSCHGQGWLPSGFFNSPQGYSAAEAYSEEIDPYAHLVKGLGFENGSEMEIVEMVESIPQPLSYVIFDVCLMGGIEIAYELKSKTEYVIASPTEIMASGFPYMQVVDNLFSPSSSLINRLKGVTKSFYDYYSDETTGGGTISLVQTNKLPQVATSAKAIFDSDRANIPNVNLNNVQKYFRMNKHWFYDINSFMEEISSNPDQLTAFQKALDDAIVVKYATDRFLSLQINEFSGLSIYIPKPENAILDEFYQTYQWNIDSQMIQ